MSIRNDSIGASDSDSQASPAATGPAVVPSMNAAEYEQS